VIVSLLVVIIVGFVWWGIAIYRFMTIPQPTHGGHYIEAFVGQPRYINPLLAHSSSTDQSLTRLVFNRLFDYDASGLLTPDLAERYEVSDDMKEYTIFLRKDVLWHDGEIFAADDVIYTIGIMQDIAYGAVGVSNESRLLWQDIRVEKIDDHTIKFILNEPQSMFLHKLNMGVLPKHIWENVSAEQFQLAEYNLKPIGTGPYKFVDFDVSGGTIASYVLRANEDYYHGEPFITRFMVNFYSTRDEAVLAYNAGKVSAVMVDKMEHVAMLEDSAKSELIELPHYFAVFLNQTKSVPLAYDEVREALSRGTDRDAIVAEVFGGDAVVRYSPFGEGVVGYDHEVQQTGFDRESANILLDEKGWEKGDDGIRSKDDERLAFMLHVSGNHQQFMRTAEILRDQWREIGVDLTIQPHDKDDLESNTIKTRDYDALLYAHQMRFEPNLLPLWHSSEKNDPGMNYAIFAQDEMDDALANLLTTKNVDEQMSLYKKQQEILQKEVPAIFLFAPQVALMHSDTIKGIDVQRVNTSHDRYTDVHTWYIKQKRVKK
jgi:peptide/nickel transport system substrate-binding protein